MTRRSGIKKLIAGFLSFSILWLSPGLLGYQALAGEISRNNSSEADIPSFSLPVNSDSNLGPLSSPIELNIEDNQALSLKIDDFAPVEKANSLASVIPVSSNKTAQAKTRVGALSSDKKFVDKIFPVQLITLKSKSAAKTFQGTIAELKNLKLSSIPGLGRFFDGSKSRSNHDLDHLSQQSSDESSVLLKSRLNRKSALKKETAWPKIESANILESDLPLNLENPLPQKGFKWLSEVKNLPSSFLWRYVPGWSIATMGGEIQGVALPVFTAQTFGLPQAIEAAGLSLLARIPGAWLSAFFVGRFSPKTISNFSTVLTALSVWMIPAAFALKFSPPALFSVFLANSFLSGLTYGATRGITQNLIPPLLISNRAQREFGLNYAYQWTEPSSVLAAMLAVPLLHWLGGSAVLAISSALFLISTFFYASLKLNKPQHQNATSNSPSKTGEERALSWRQYAPFVFFRFMHFSMYSVFATVLALGVFHSDRMAGNIIGSYDVGAWIFGFLATLTLLPKKGKTSWAFAGIGVAMAFLWGSFLFHLPILSMMLAGALGGMIMINTNKWMSFYQEKLPQAKLKNLSKWMMTASIFAALPIFIATSLGKLVPSLKTVLAMPHIIIGANILASVFALVTFLSLRGQKRKSSSRGPPANLDAVQVPSAPIPSNESSRSPAHSSSKNTALVSQLRSHIKEQLSLMTIARGYHDIFEIVSQSSGEFLDLIESHLHSGAINPHLTIRTSSAEPIRQERHFSPARIGIYPVAADPFHWGHLLIGLQAVAHLKLDKVIYVLAGDDPRKPQMTPASIRHPLGISVLNLFNPFYAYSPIAIGTTADGETNLFKILALNAGRTLEAFYLVGDDHYRLKDKNGNDDTILKIEKNRENPVSAFDASRHNLNIAFIEREGKKEEVPSVLPVFFMPNIPFEASSTAIRSGGYHLMPYEAYRAIQKKGLGLYGIEDTRPKQKN